MARRRATVDVVPLMASVASELAGLSGGGSDAAPELTARLLDAGASLLTEYGLRRWSMDDVADRAGVGRTSVYRKFASRDHLVDAVLARELRQVFRDVTETAARYDTLLDKFVEGALVALAAAEGSLVTALLASDPTTFLPFLTTDAAPLIALGRELLVTQAIALNTDLDYETAAEFAELAARIGLSFLLTRETVFPVHDLQATRRSLRRVFEPLLAPLSAPA